VPDCYFIVASEPEETGKDISACVKEKGGPGWVHKLSLELDTEKVHTRVHYDTSELAREYLKPIKECLERKGHTVERAVVIEDFEELGIAVPGYPPQSDASAAY
jgi:hypothetical protein